MAEAAKSLSQWPKLLFIGDSLTEFGFSTDGCWLARIADRLRRRCDLCVRGFSGYTTRWWREALPLLVPDGEPTDPGDCAACVVFLGANDSSRGAVSPTLHVPLPEFRKNTEWILRQLMQRRRLEPRQLLLINIPPVDEVAYSRDCQVSGFPFDKYLEDCQVYNAVLSDISRECGVQLVDVYTPLIDHENWRELFSDGIHFNSRGSNVVFNCIWPAIEELTHHLPVLLPDFEEAARDGFATALTKWKERNCFD